MELMQWLDLLPTSANSANERLICARRFTNAIKIPAETWRLYFKGFGGITVENTANGLALRPASTGGRAVPTTDRHQTEELGLRRNVWYCITRREHTNYLKRLTSRQVSRGVPGPLVIDTYGRYEVLREWSCSGTPADLTTASVHEMVEAMGQLRRDPVTPLLGYDDKTAYRTKRYLLGTHDHAAGPFADDYRRGIAGRQQPNGSWEDNALETAYCILDWLVMGGSAQDNVVRQGVAWLTTLPEPAGAPGAFNATSEITELWNSFRDQNPEGRVSGYDRLVRDRHRRAEILPHLAHGDVCGMASEFCDARHLFVTGIVLQALLSAGASEHPRVQRAIARLLMAPWCQEHYHGAGPVLPTECVIDFGGPASQLFGDNEWGLDAKTVTQLRATTVLKDGRAYVSPRLGMGCASMIGRALSYHPQWPDSTLASRVAIGFVRQLGWDWSHIASYPSTVLSYLSRFPVPVAQFGAARLIPQLIRAQRDDGLWDESDRNEPVTGRNKHLKFAPGGCVPPLRPEQSTYLICQALSDLGLLDVLRPDRNCH